MDSQIQILCQFDKTLIVIILWRIKMMQFTLFRKLFVKQRNIMLSEACLQNFDSSINVLQVLSYNFISPIYS